MKRNRIPFRVIVTAIFFLAGCRQQETGQFLYSGSDDSRVMLQGFYWESYRHGHPAKYPEITPGVANGDKTWYEIVGEKAPEIRNGYFDLIWLPPPSYAGGGAGYSPVELFNPNNAYGDSLQQREMLAELWNNGIEPVADIVINHRNGSSGWTDFVNPSWNTRTICKYDEAFTNSASEAYNLPLNKRGADEEYVHTYDPERIRAYAYESFRDIDHTNSQVREDILRYLLFLKSFGYLGWRYDMVHGYHARHIADYNRVTQPSFSVGEYDWNDQPGQRGWIWYTATDTNAAGNDRLGTASAVFDFTTYFILRHNIGFESNVHPDYLALYAFGNGTGLMGDNTDNLPWKNKAVTFLENHDTGWRTNEDGSNEQDHDNDSFLNNRQVEQGYAYILTHPGIPCVFWKHYFDWGQPLQDKIRALIIARKAAGVNSGSTIHTRDNARDAGVYAALIEGTKGQLFVRIGGNDSIWNPSLSSYTGYLEYVSGDQWKVWVKMNDPQLNQSPQTFPLNASLGIIPVPAGFYEVTFPDR